MNYLGHIIVLVVIPVALAVWMRRSFNVRLLCIVWILAGVALMTFWGRDAAPRHAADQIPEGYERSEGIAWKEGSIETMKAVSKYDLFFGSVVIGLAALSLTSLYGVKKEDARAGSERIRRTKSTGGTLPASK